MIKITNAYKTYKNGKNSLTVIDNTTLELPENGLISIFGKSGCGKTTLLNVIGGLDNLDKGQIFIDNQLLNKNPDYIRNKYIGYIFQNYYLNVNVTVLENVKTTLRLCGMVDEEEIERRSMIALRNVDMENYAKRTPDCLSGGQMQRVAIARAIVKNPKIILADEPTGNLDELNTIKVMDLLRKIANDHLVVLVTHETSLVNQYCDQVIEIVDGKVVSIHNNEILNTDTISSSMKNKNDIYLGELNHHKISSDCLNINCYGDFNEKIDITIVNVNGKLYVETKNIGTKLVDENSEVKFKEGKFVEKTNNTNVAKHDLEFLPTIEGNNYGRLFKFKDSLINSLKNIRQPRKSKKFMTGLLLILSIVLVFSIASSGTNLKNLINIKNKVLDDAVYIAVRNEKDYNGIYESINQYGITNVAIENPINLRENNNVFVYLNNFVSTFSPKLIVNSSIYNSDFCEGELLYGEKVFDDKSAVITQEFAEKILEDAQVNNISKIKDIIDNNAYIMFNNVNLSIKGIVKGNKTALYVSNDNFIKINKGGYINPNIVSSSYLPPSLSVNDGEVILSPYYKYLDGDKISILGKEFTVKKCYKNINEKFYSYFDYCIMNERNLYFEYFNSQHSENSKVENCELYLDYLFDKTIINDYVFYSSIYDCGNQNELKVLKTDDLFAKTFILTNGNANYVCAFLKYKELHQKTPTKDQLDLYLNEYFNEINIYQDFYNNIYNNMYYDYYGSDKDFNAKEITSQSIFMSENDYNRLSYQVGYTESKIIESNYQFYNFEELLNSNLYLIVKTSDYDSTVNYLTNLYGEGDIITKDELNKYFLNEQIIEIISSGIGVIVILAFMCICSFFIMRSAFMPRVKEVGIYRAIGVSRKNIIFKFFIETVVECFVSSLLGYIISCIILAYLSKLALFNEMFYFPVWMGIITFLIIFGASVLFGILPVYSLTKKTPSQILAKHDI